MDWAKTTAKVDKKHLSFGIWCDLYYRFYGRFQKKMAMASNYTPQCQWDAITCPRSSYMILSHKSSNVALLPVKVAICVWQYIAGSNSCGSPGIIFPDEQQCLSCHEETWEGLSIPRGLFH